MSQYLNYCVLRDKLYGLNTVIYDDITSWKTKCIFTELRMEKDMHGDTLNTFSIEDIFYYPRDFDDDMINFSNKVKYNMIVKAINGLSNYDEIEWINSYTRANEKRIFYREMMDYEKQEKNIVTTDDVILNDNVKHDVVQVIDFIKKADKYTAIGSKFPHGFLLAGAPGTGKTLIARAISNECGCHFASYSGSEFAFKHVGVAPQRIKDMFEDARRHSPSIIFIDEIDALCMSRGEDTNGEDLKAINQLLVEMDGINGKNDVFVIASTNRIDLLDKAILREGRFDRKIILDLPDWENRVKIFKLYLSKLKCEDYLEYETYADLTEGVNGARIFAIANESGIRAVDEGRDKVSHEDILYMIEKLNSYKSKNEEKKEKVRIGF